MGKHAQYLKRGTVHHFGTMSPPIPAEWAINSTTINSILVDRLVAVPSPGTFTVARAIKVSDGSLAASQPGWSGTTGTIVGLTGATQYRVQIAWRIGSVQISDWSDVKLATTL